MRQVTRFISRWLRSRWSAALPSAVLLSGLLLQLLLAQPVNAQSSSANSNEGRLDEVIVTATRREESLEKVPLSVTAFTRAEMDDNNVRTIDDIAKMTPGVAFTRSANMGAIATIAIRGIVSNAGVSTNGVYIDDTPIQMRQNLGGLGTAVWPQVFDLERVEILRGPQGTLFGSGSMGGAIRLITPKPNTTETSVYSRADLSFTEGGAPSHGVGLAVNLPLVDNVLGLRLSGSFRQDGGYVDRWTYADVVAQKNSNFADTRTFRVALGWHPTDNVTITPSVFYQKQFYNDSGVFWTDHSNKDKSQFVRLGEMPISTSDRFTLSALKVQWDLGPVSLFSNTSHFDRAQLGVGDLAVFEASLWGHMYNRPPVGMYAPDTNISDQNIFTQEFRVQSADPDARLTWQAGVFYQDAKQLYKEFVEDTFLPAIAQANDPQHRTFEEIMGMGLLDGKYTVVVDPWDTEDKHLAVFGQVDFKITDQLTATVGLRKERAKLWSHIVYDGPVQGGRYEYTANVSESPSTPKFGLSYQVNPGLMTYLSVSKGYRIGGTNQPVPVSSCGQDFANIGLTEQPAGYKSDSLWAYELGSKMRTDDGRFAVDASVYLIKWKNLQVNYNLPTCGFSFTTNAGSITSKGVELSVQARPVPALSVGASLGYTYGAVDRDTYYGGSSTPVAGAGDTLVSKGNRQVVPPYTVSLYGEYDFPLLSHDAYFRINYNYASSLTDGIPRLDKNNGNYDEFAKGLATIRDLTLKLGAHFGGVDASLYINNALNQAPWMSYSHAVRASRLFTGSTVRPRTVGMTANYRF